MAFPVVMYGWESWTIKKAEGRRIDAFELWCWRRLFRVPWTTRRSNQSILKKISPEYSLEGVMLKLKLQYFGHLMRRTDSFEKTLDAGKDWRQEEKGMTGWDGWAALLTQTWVWVNSRRWWRTGRPGVLQSMGSQSQTQLSDWTELNWTEWASLVAQLVKNLPAMRETWVRSLGWEDRLEKGTATHSSILAWRIPWTHEPTGSQWVGLSDFSLT